MNRTSTSTLIMALLIVCALVVSTGGTALAAQPMGITPTATDTTEPPTNTPTPTNTQPVTNTPTPTSTSDVGIPTSTDTPTPTATSDLGISTATPTPTTDISITATATATGTVIVNPPTDDPGKTPTQVPILPSTGEFPFDPTRGLEWLFAFLLVVALAALIVRNISRSKIDQ